MFQIYQLTNQINGKRYIGFSSQGAHRRWDRHKIQAKQGLCSSLHCAIRKYGFEKFKLEVLEEGWNPELGLEIREPYWISVLKPEYNMTKGGEGSLGLKHSDNTKRKMSLASMGKKKTPEHRANISKGKLGLTPRLGCKLSEDTKKRISLSTTGRIAWNKGMRGGVIT